MAIPTAPLFGFGASGQLGKALVYGQWKGIPIARRYVVPANPRTAGQQTQRGYLRNAVDDWHRMLLDNQPLDAAAWTRYAGTLGPMTGFNAAVRYLIDRYVAGSPPDGLMSSVDVTDPSHGAMDVAIKTPAGPTDTISMHWGPTASFQGSSATQAAVLYVASFTNIDTLLPAGATVYYWFNDDSANARSGLYSTVLT